MSHALTVSLSHSPHYALLFSCWVFRRVRFNKQDWETYAHVDASRHYTRNLIATDHVSYTLLLLCWNPGQESPIHDHPCDGCWMEVLQGQIQECRYRTSVKDDGTTKLECTQDKTFDEDGGIVFIEDSLGLHKVGNPGTQPAVTMHVYSPPFQSCKIWLDESKKPSKSSICNYSEYGRLV
jgi:cysteine dioxygenase